MLPIFSLIAFSALAGCSPVPTYPDIHGAALVDYVNSLGKWKAALDEDYREPNLVEPYRGADLAAFAAAKAAAPKRPKSKFAGRIPKEFDSRKQWPKCAALINEIVDQTACGCCWAASSAAAMTDRLCIASGGRIQSRVSTWDLLTCSGAGSCHSGSDWLVYANWNTTGFVTGSTYEKRSGCMPFQFAPCKHYLQLYRNSSYPRCPAERYIAPKCSPKCQEGYGKSYDEDKSFGFGVEFPDTVEEMQIMIMEHGPITASYTVFEDFHNYYEGIYEHLAGKMVSAHAVRLIGWGEENGVPYWTVANSWNADWGENNGFFRIRRGVNECNIELFAASGIPDLSRSFGGEFAHLQ